MAGQTLDPSVASQGIEGGSSDSGFLREAVAISEPATGEIYTLTRLKAGEVLSDRFAIERLAGSGGMRAVYRALDRLTGEAVALKVMARRGHHEERFAQGECPVYHRLRACGYRRLRRGRARGRGPSRRGIRAF